MQGDFESGRLPGRIDRRIISRGGEAGCRCASARQDSVVARINLPAVGRSSRYGIAAYNNMAKYNGSLLIGLHLRIGGNQTGLWHGLDPRAFFLIRSSDGTYELQQIIDTSLNPSPLMVATRSLLGRLFPTTPQAHSMQAVLTPATILFTTPHGSIKACRRRNKKRPDFSINPRCRISIRKRHKRVVRSLVAVISLSI
jgi:hypothetical protein